MSSGECYTQSVKVDEQVTLLGGSQVHLQPAPLLIFIVVCRFNAIQHQTMERAKNEQCSIVAIIARFNVRKEIG
jgi:hypothetical protein